MIPWIALGILVAAAWAGIAVYNNLIQLKNLSLNCFGQIDVQLKRRYDLIPQLVEVAKAYMAHERQSLEAVITARNQALALTKDAANMDPKAVNKLIGADAALNSAVGKLFALSEAYPELKANQNMMQLTEELTSTENRVSFARQAYNDAVMDYNTACETFPGNLYFTAFKFQKQTLWQIEQVDERESRPIRF